MTIGTYVSDLEAANELAAVIEPDSVELTAANLQTASLDIDNEISGTWDPTTNLKLDIDDLSDQDASALIRAVVAQSLWRQKLPEDYAITDNLEQVRSADGSSRERAPELISPKARFYLSQSNLPVSAKIKASLGTTRTIL